MVHTTINLFDLIVFGVLGLSALLSFFRGFVREILSLGAWVGASIITLYAFPHVAAMIKPHVNNVMVASGFAAMFTFMGSLIIISVFNSLLLKFMKSGSDIGVLDNMMGLVFGIARGALLVAVAYFIFSLTTARDDYPDWMKGSVSLPYVEKLSDWVKTVAPAYLEDVKPDSKNDAGDAVEDAVDDAEKQQQQNIPAADSDTNWPTMDDLKHSMGGDK